MDRHALTIAVGVGLGSTLLAALALGGSHVGSGDLTWLLDGATSLLHGHDPYTATTWSRPLPYSHPAPALYYPLPAVLIALPFLPLPGIWAGAVFFGCGAGLLAYAISRHHPELWPVFLSGSFFFAARVAQFSPLVTAAAFLPWLWPLAFAKPNVACAVFSYRPSWRGALATGVAFVLSLLLVPAWPLEALRNDARLGATDHWVPVVIFPALLLALLAWRRPAGRLLVVLAVLPQSLYLADQLPLFLVARTRREALVLAVTSWIGYGVWWLAPHPFTGSAVAGAVGTLIGLYLPALALLLWHEWRDRAPTSRPWSAHPSNPESSRVRPFVAHQ